MKNYTFVVRPWNVDFFIALKDLLEKDGPSHFLFLTMQTEAYENLISKEIEVIFLPDALQEYQGIDTKEIENEFSQFFGFNTNKLYDIERFKAEEISHNLFINKHLECLYDLIKSQTILVSHTLDHFVYILATHINEMKGGTNVCIQPMGFPRNANVILSSPWQINPYRESSLGEEMVESYIDSLKLRPEESIHYMKVQKSEPRSITSKISSLSDQYSRHVRKKAMDSPFKYLERKTEHPIKTLMNRTQKSKKWEKVSVSVKDLQHKIETKKVRNLFYFPLQLEPEMSTLAYSPYLRNQIEIARLLAMNIDPQDLIVLKENPKMLNTREDSFYAEIEKLPNIVWAGFKENSRDIIRLSYKVVTVTGTAAIEAACLGIKSMIFGYPPYYKMLVQSPISDYPLKEIRKHMYADYNTSMIRNKISEGWSEYSKAVFTGDMIPKWDGEKLNLVNSEKIADRVYKEILSNLG